MLNENSIAQGYIKDGKIYFYFDFPMLQRLEVSNVLGKDLVDFIWLDQYSIKDIFSDIYTQYILCLHMKLSNDDILDRLLIYLKKEFNINIYLTVYIHIAIDFLLSDEKEENIFEIFGEEMANELSEVYTVNDIKGLALKKLAEIIKNQQMELEDNLEQIIGENTPLNRYTPSQRLFILSQSKENEAFYLNTKFVSYLSAPYDFSGLDEKGIEKTIDENNIEFFEMYDIETILDMARFEMVQMIKLGCLIKRCKFCKKYFIPVGRTDSEYCTRIMSVEGRPCNEIGAFRVRNAKLNNDPVYRAYSQAYRRMDSQKRVGTITNREFNEWSYQASLRRDECIEGKITLEEFTEWLDKTKKRK